MRRIALLAAASVMLATTSVAGGQKKSGAETALLGVHLYDSSLKVVALYGTPTTIEAISLGSTSGGAGGGASGPANGGPMGPQGGGPTGGGRGAGKGGSLLTPSAGFTNPIDDAFDFGGTILQKGPGGAMGAPRPGGSAGTGMPPGLPGVPGGGGGRMGGPAGGSAGGNVGGGGGNSNDHVVFTRWVYNRGGSKYGFVIDKFSRVIQIEAIGISNPKVHTQRGISFGSTFAQVVKRYNRNPDGTASAPEGFDINGDTFVVRYLVRNKVAFRFSRLGKDKPQVVTGIAIAAGKL